MAKFIEEHEPDTPTGAPHFGEDIVIEKEAHDTVAGFKLQYMLDPSFSDAERYPLKLNNLIVMNIDPDVAPEKIVWAADRSLEHNDIPNVGFAKDKYYKPWEVVGGWVAYTNKILAIDPSGRGADETAYSVIYVSNGRLYLVENGGYTGGYTPETLDKLAETAKKHDIKCVVVESNFGDSTWLELFKKSLRKVHRCQCDEIRAKKAKEIRIADTLEPLINSHQLVVDKELIKKDFHSTTKTFPKDAHQYMLMYQMSRLTRDKGSLKHEDRLDSLALGVEYLRVFLAISEDDEIQKREDILDEQFRKRFDTKIQMYGKYKENPRKNWGWDTTF